MKKLFFGFVVVIAALVATRAEAQTPFRGVAPPKTEVGPPLDPETPLGRVQEIAERLKNIEAETALIREGLAQNKIPDFNGSIAKILESTASTRHEVAQLGAIASNVDYVASSIETIGENTAAIGDVAESVATLAVQLQGVATLEALDGAMNEVEVVYTTALKEAVDAQTAEITSVIDARIADEKAEAVAKIAAYQEQMKGLRGKIELASNVIILLWVALLILIGVNICKFVFDRVSQARAAAEAQNQKIREFLAANEKKAA
jgi:hypothetical protein